MIIKIIKAIFPKRNVASSRCLHIQPYMKLAILTAILLCACTGCSSGKGNTTTPFVPSEGSYLKASNTISFDMSSLSTVRNNPDAQLSVPTYITKIDDTYFIVDCYHNRVIYNTNLTDPIYKWWVMTEDMKMGHTIASDGNVYLIDDTENNRILIMEKGVNENGVPVFYPSQEFTEIGMRPHYIIYDSGTDTFYAWSSLTGEMYLFRKSANDNSVYLTEIRSIPELYGYYVRSFTIMDNHIYFVSGNSNIIEADLDTFEIIKKYPVPDTYAGMSQITKIQDYYYITVSTDINMSQDTATILRTKSLDGLATDDYEDIYSEYFVGGGTPYCITSIDDCFYLCEHRLVDHAIWQFKVSNNQIIDVNSLY